METTTKTTYDWDFIMTDSDYNISLKLLEVYNNDDYDELGKALKAYHEGSIKGAEYELLHELRYLMKEIILWNSCGKYKTQNRREIINRHRNEIEMIKEFNSWITKDTILKEWKRAFYTARDLAEIELPECKNVIELKWDDVFKNNY